MRGIDVVLEQQPGGIFDIAFAFDGDVLTEDAFDTAIIVSLFTDARADVSEVAIPERRRGWAGNEVTPGFVLGGKLWLFTTQSRITRTVMNEMEDAARDSLTWMVDRGLATGITGVSVTMAGIGILRLALTIERSPSQIERRFFELWNATGVPT